MIRTSCSVILIMEHKAPPHRLKNLNLCTAQRTSQVRIYDSKGYTLFRFGMNTGYTLLKVGIHTWYRLDT